ncbi:XRE family transcriptional regulator [Stieleria mannarensis]|uniref:XRE family transcriptional regulator n=1 Tax=Stieleria mannarensis TaxID=2755585 RepID=UPI0025702489|nr:XRE family transcriptional regulator [Rhodopirellula sp. JC639]
MTQFELADHMDVNMSYNIKVENEELHFGDYPSEKFIHKLAIELKADEDELLLLADKVPALILRKIRQRPGLFHRIAKMNKKLLGALELSMQTMGPGD